jgi:hypothetical protein
MAEDRDMIRRIAGIMALGFFILFNLATADEYKKYYQPESGDCFLQISFISSQTVFTFMPDDTINTFTFNRSDILRTGQEISIKGQPFLNEDGFIINGKTFQSDIIDKVNLEKTSAGETKIYFLKKSGEPKSPRGRKQNEISLLKNINIAGDRFIRGSVVAFWADIRIDGEVNEDVVAVYGDIVIGDNAVIRGNIVAVNGHIDVSRKATIYGSIQSSSQRTKDRLNKWRRWYRTQKSISPIFYFYYNRVDGAAPYLGAHFLDEDSLLPEIKVYAGYAFESARWRYHVGIEQTFFKSSPVTVGGTLYRRLASNDDWIIKESENTAFALLATQDYKDYFEADGGYGFARIKLFSRLSGELGFLSEKYKWLNGHRMMWSLFGGSKRFPENFSSIEGAYRVIGIKEIDSHDIASLITKINFDSGESDSLFGSSFWKASAELEWAADNWNSDVDFTQYKIVFSRHQSFGQQSGLLLKTIYGGSDGYLPLHRKFFLGGMGTLHGYEQKQFYGTEFWLGDIEYGIRLPNSDLIAWFFYNMGQIGDGPGKLADAEVKHSLGMGLSFGDEIKLIVAKRLDRSGASPLLSVRFGFTY